MQTVRGLVSILTALCVLSSSAYCACVAVAQPLPTAGSHVCCRQDHSCPAKPGHPPDPARDCPHCDGSAVTAAPQPTQDLQNGMTLLPAPDFDVAIDAA